MASKSHVVITDRRTLTRVLEQDTFIAMSKTRYDELIGQIEYLEEVIEALKGKFQDTRSLEEIVEQYEDELDEQLAARPAFHRRVAEARANYAAGKGGNWDEIVRQRKRNRK